MFSSRFLFDVTLCRMLLRDTSACDFQINSQNNKESRICLPRTFVASSQVSLCMFSTASLTFPFYWACLLARETSRSLRPGLFETVRNVFARPTPGAVSTRLPSWDISSLYRWILRMSDFRPPLFPSRSLSCAHTPVTGVRFEFSSLHPRLVLSTRVRLSTPRQLLLSELYRVAGSNHVTP